MMRRRVRATARAVVVSLHVAAIGGLRAQTQPGLARETGWIVAGDAATDLWFHTFAVLGISGPGTLPFYDAGYASAIAEEKVRRGSGPSRLDRDAPRLRRAIMADSAFELLHFLPLYLERTTPDGVPRILRQIAATSPPTLAPAEVIGAVRSALSSRAQRAVLMDLADAIEDEWRTFHAGYAASRAAADVARRRALQTRWDDAFAPRLAGVIRVIGASRGVLLISPALGAEGRVVDLRASGIIVAVSDRGAAATPDAPLLASIRELCFPLLQRIREGADASAPAAVGADESSRAAVQCGAQLVEALVPSSASEYRELFLSRRPGESAAAYRRRFDQRFHTGAATLRALSAEIARIASPAGASP